MFACSVLFWAFVVDRNGFRDMAEPTVLGRFKPPKSRGVDGFSFPVYRKLKWSKGKWEKRVYLSWKTRPQDCSLTLKEWSNFSWLSAQIKVSAKTLVANAVDITDKQLRIVSREQQQLWASAVNQSNKKPRLFDVKRKKHIIAKSKGLKRVSVPTCVPELVGVRKVPSEAAVILGPGNHKGTLEMRWQNVRMFTRGDRTKRSWENPI